MQRNIDKWIYTIECANPEGNEDLSKDHRFNIFGWKWSKGYDSVDVIGKLYTRGILKAHGEDAYVIGEIVKGDDGVVLC